jgi:hypothetical protein
MVTAKVEETTAALDLHIHIRLVRHMRLTHTDEPDNLNLYDTQLKEKAGKD